MKINKSVILTATACVGVVGTAIVSFQAGRKYESGTNQWPPATDNKIFIPPVIIGGLTITAIVLNQHFNAKTIMGLAGSLGYVTLNRDELEHQIEAKYGKDALKDLKHKAAAAISGQVELVEVEETGYGDTLCVLGYSGRLIRTSLDAAEKAVAEFINMYDEGQSVCLNDAYELLGARKTHFGNQFGYPDNPDFMDEPIDIEVSFVPKEEIVPWSELAKYNEDLIVIDVYTYPMMGWAEM